MKLELAGELTEIGRQTLLIRDIAFSPDGKLLASAGTDSIIRFWNVATQKEVGQISWEKLVPYGYSTVESVAFSPDGSLFAACGGIGSLALFHTSNFQLITEFPLQKRTKLIESSVAFSSCSKYLAVVGWNNSLRLISVQEQKLIQQINLQGWLHSIAFHPTKKLLAVGGSSFVRLFDFDQGFDNLPKKIPLDTAKLGSNNVDFNSDGTCLAIACNDDSVRIYQVNKKKPHFICQGHRGGSTALAWHPRNNLFISGDATKFIYLWDGENGELLTSIDGHQRKVSCLKWRSNGEIFASASWDRSIKFWQIV